MKKSFVDKYVYAGDNFIEDLWNLRGKLFELAKEEEIRQEKRCMRKKSRASSIEVIDVSLIIFYHKEKVYVLSFSRGVDISKNRGFYEDGNFVTLRDEEVKDIEEMFLTKVSSGPARRGITIEVYKNTSRSFLYEAQLPENLEEFILDDKGGVFLEGFLDENNNRKYCINELDILVEKTLNRN